MGERLPLLVKNIVLRAREIGVSPRRWMTVPILALNFSLIILGRRSNLVSIKRFLNSNKFHVDNKIRYFSDIQIDLLFLATRKDFPLLARAIPAAQSSLSNYTVGETYVVVPSSMVEECSTFLDRRKVHALTLNEENFISPYEIERLASKFGSRFGWILQQILKILFVSQSKASAVLVVDADTVLTTSRNWLDNRGKQILLPSWEFNNSYYEVLRKMGICSESPEHTFVSHHMLMQPDIMKEICEHLKWADSKSLVDYVLQIKASNSQSPISIDYELYAQYLISRYPKRVALKKWANLEVVMKPSRSLEIDDYIDSYKNRFASVSFHSYDAI
jgi:hypothetical protein